MSGQNPVTPSSKSRSTNTLVDSPKTPSSTGLSVRQIFKNNGMPIEDKQAISDYSAIKTWADKICGSERHSAMRQESAQQILETNDKYAKRNEDTYFRNLWPKLFRDDREIRHKGTELAEPFWNKVAWDKSHLDANWNYEFRRDSLPKLNTKGNKILQAIIDQNDRIKNPKPDITYGLDEKAFSLEEQRVNEANARFAGISKGIWHPGFLVEGKVAKVITEVEEQCCRGGAALVKAGRQIVELSGASISDIGADMKTAVFSLALVPQFASMFVHWAEVQEPDVVIYHMHFVKDYSLRREGGVTELRHDIDNVLDWMVLERKNWLKTVLGDIIKREQSGTLPPQLPAPEYNSSSEDELQDNESGGVGLTPTSNTKGKKRRLG